MADATDVISALARLSHGIAKKVDEAPTGVAPGFHSALGGTVLPNGKVRYAAPSGGTLLRAIYKMDNSTANISVAAAAEEQIDYNVQVYDPAGLVTTGASWKYTAPEAGYVRIYATLQNSQTTWRWWTSAIEGDFYIFVKKNGGSSGAVQIDDYSDMVTDNMIVNLNGETMVSVAAGDELSLWAGCSNESGTGSLSFAASSSRCWVWIYQ